MAKPASGIDLQNLAHDLRSPLASIRATAEAALFDETLSEKSRAVLLSLIGEVDRLAKATEKLYEDL